MKKKNPITVRIGSRGHQITEPVKGMIFTYPDIPGEWYLLQNSDRYVLCRNAGKYLTFVELYCGRQNIPAFYIGREWDRRPRNANDYVLTRPKCHGRASPIGIRLPLGFAQYVKNAIRDAKGIGG
ncbi:MAG: hypothetical protein AABX14_04925 [Candidatus Aenigmatarchaeota archaeon]